LPAYLADLLRANGLPAEVLTLEITESAAMDPEAADRLLPISNLGVNLSIDDFGTGYSSLAYLKRLPVSELKIDRSFVMALDTDADDAAIVIPTIDLGHNLGLSVVAEGVENEASELMLLRHGCDFAQGYHVSRPMIAGALQGWLESGEWPLAPLT
jgi:EAL domain-containing protein (putative c-di-GMP-specific phosphodiesterase class I)